MAGDFAGGLVAGGGVEPDGETAGDCEGGDKVGDFAGGAGWVAGEGGLAVGDEGDDLGEGAGALSARTEHKDVKNNANTKSGRNLLFIIVIMSLRFLMMIRRSTRKW